MPLLFSYGTLQETAVQIATFGRELHGERDELVAFETASVPIDDPELARQAGRTHFANAAFTGKGDTRVSGTAFDVTDEELLAADIYERLAGYVRILATLASGKPAWLYVDGRSANLRNAPPDAAR
jgi:hypothetical protein